MRWLAVAVLVHGAALALLPRPRSAQPSPEPSTVGPAEVDVELASPEPTPAPSQSHRAEALAMTRSGLAHGESSASRPPASPTPEVIEPQPDTAFSFDPTRPLELSADAVGLGRRNPFLGGLPDERSASVPAEAPGDGDNVAPGVTQSVTDALHERDVSLGLGSAGPVITVAEELTRPSDAPVNSRAVFEVTANGRGEVTGLQLLDVSGGRLQWEKVATAMREALRGRTLHVPSGAGGVSITLEVTSRWQLPSGHDPDTEVSVLGVPVRKARPESKQPIHVEILKPTLKVVEAPPPPDTNAPVKLPTQRLEMTLFGTDVDPTDLVPRPLRVVHAHVMREVVR
jgi:hypothetical protein